MIATINNVELIAFGPGRSEGGSAWEPPTVAEMAAVLTRYAFDAKRAVEVPLSTAFRRAVAAKKDRKQRLTVLKNGKTVAQIDHISAEDDRIEGVRVQSWTLDGAEVTGPELDVASRQLRYDRTDVTRIIHKVLKEDGLGAYSFTGDGPPYFVPAQNRESLDRLEAALHDLKMEVARGRIEDTESQRRQVMDSVAAGLADEACVHEKAIAGYSEQTRPKIVENRREAMAATVRLVQSLALFLNGNDLILVGRLMELDQKCVEVLAQIAAYRPVARGRLITPMAQGVAG